MCAARKLFVTGRPGVGKTTLILRAIELLRVPMHGFYTRELRAEGRRVGFEIADLAGSSAVMARVGFPGPVRVGRYGVDLDAVERVGVRALEKALRDRALAVIDEVGRMELACPAFVDVLGRVMDAGIPVLGTIHARAGGVAEAIRRRHDVCIVQVTPSNRDGLPAELARMFREAAE